MSYNQGLTQDAGAAISTIGIGNPLLIGNSTSIHGSVQGTRRFGRNFSGYLSYTALQQSFSGTVGSNN